ncbi:MAG: Rpp14/Pop5 family protein [Nanoarchaeota archaeon]
MKLKRLLPSLRDKKRYIVFELIAKGGLDYNMAKKGIKESISWLIGELGMAKAGLRFLDEWKNNKGIITVNRSYVDETRVGMSLVKNISNIDVIVRTVGVSGILKKAKARFFN